MLRINIKPERVGFKTPEKGSKFAACYDAFVAKVEFKDGMAICYLGFSTEVPEGFKGVISARSNITKHGWVLANGIGIIDADYRGEWQARFRPLIADTINNKGVGSFPDPEDLFFKEFPYAIGDACCQIYFERELEIAFMEVDETSGTERGDGGFGHSDGK